MKKQLLFGAALLGLTATAQTVQDYRLENVVQITRDATHYDNPQWSPCGSMVAYTRFGYDGLYVSQAKKWGKSSQLCERDGIGYMFQWSADGTEILVRDTRLTGQRRLHAAWSVSISDKTITRLSEDAEDMQPAAWRYDDNGEVNIVYDGHIKPIGKKMDAMKIHMLTGSHQIPHLCQTSFITDCENLYAIGADGSKTKIYKGAAFGPALSPDGRRVAFATMADEITVMNIDGSEAKIVTKGFSPSWLNDNQLVFHRTTDDGHAYLSGQIFAVDIATGTVKKLSKSTSEIEMNPSVSPDGTQIAFVRFNDGQIYVADIKQ